MSYAIDDAEYIRRRLEEIEAEKKLALTGTSAPAEKVIIDHGPAHDGFNDIAQADAYKAIETVYGYGGGIDYMALKSNAHPGWPYAGTPHEWRGFVKVT